MKLFLKVKWFIVLIIFNYNGFYFALDRTGTLTGNVVDATSGEKIIGANIIIEGTNLGATTDIEGKYKIKNIPEGKQNIRASYISYKLKQFNNIEIKADIANELNITLEPDTITTCEVVIVDKANMGYEGALLNKRKNANAITDGISAELIAKSTDASTADALKRISSVTIMDNKYVYIRGASERYNGALLNNSPLASVEPDKKSFAFDLIPSKLIESSTIVKTFTPELPGDFSGGLVNINTVDFPKTRGISFSYESKYIADVTSKTYGSYNNGGINYLGLDNGERQLPNGFPPDLEKLNRSQKDSLAGTLKNNWKVIGKKVPINHSFAINYTDIFNIFGNDLGLIASASYKTKTTSQSVVLRDFENENTYLYNFSGNRSLQNVFWGGVLNLSYKLSGFNKLSFKNSFSVNSDDEVTELEGFYNYYSAYQKKTGFRYISRWLVSSQLMGESYFPFLDGTKIEYSASYSKSLRDEPDYKSLIYSRNSPEDKYLLQLPYAPDGNSGSRFFSVSKENSRGIGLNIEVPVNQIKFKFGGSYKNSDRGFSARLLGYVQSAYTYYKYLEYAPDSVFNAKDFNYGGFSIGEYINGSNNYSASDEVSAFYGMFELPFLFLNESFKFVAGLRNENFLLRIHTLTRDRKDKLNADIFENDLLYSLNLIYNLNSTSNLRLAISKTVNRPQFREMAPFAYYDFQIQSTLRGNPLLKTADITNFDLRFETYPGISRMFSISPFYKEIRNPIEKIVIPSTSNNDRTFTNAGFARVFGFEIEGRSSLDLISNLLSDFSLNINYSWIKSEINETGTFAKNRRIRQLQGQSPYVINVGLNYVNNEIETDINISYYRFGERVLEVATYLNNDVIEKPKNLIDLVISKSITKYLSLKLSCKDILAEDLIVEENDKLLRKFENHSEFSLGLSINL
jgi:hypothetical protein